MDFGYNNGSGFGYDGFNPPPPKELVVTHDMIKKEVAYPSIKKEYAKKENFVSVPSGMIPHGAYIGPSQPAASDIMLIILIIVCGLLYRAIQQLNEKLTLMMITKKMP